MKNFKKNGGFTLVELIVVIAILAILAAVAIPAYSGYIEKANAAGDETLLAAINRAFVAACNDNGISQYDVKSAVIPVNDDGSIGTERNTLTAETMVGKDYLANIRFAPGVTVTADQVNDSFARFFAGNEGAKFKTIEFDLVLNPLLGVFGFDGEVSVSYGGATLVIPQSYVNALAESGFITYDGLGTTVLLGKLEDVTALAQSLTGSNSTGNASTLMNEVFASAGFTSFMSDAMGVDITDAAARDKLLQEIQEKNPTASLGSLQANAAVLYASKNASSMSTEDVMALLTGEGNAKDTILNNMKREDEQGVSDALAQAAIAYGMYTSFAHSSYATEGAAQKDQLGAINDLNNPEFKKYMASAEGQADLEGYLSALKIINSSANDSDAVTSLLVNGFGDPNLQGAINGALGTNG